MITSVARVFALVAFGLVCSSPAWPQAISNKTVTLTPMPGMTIDVPYGWIACDDANNSRLGNAADPLSLKAQVCGALDGNSVKFAAYDPNPVGTLAFFIGEEPPDPARSPDDVANMTPDEVTALQLVGCPDITKPLVDIAKIDSCQLVTATLGGAAALKFTIVFTPTQEGEIARTVREMWMVPLKSGLVLMIVDWPKVDEANAKPNAQAVEASIRFN